LSRHFGTTVLKDIPVNGLVATKNLEAACADASSLMEQGFSTLKVKLHGVVSQDRALLRAVREAAPDAALRIDPNQSWPEAQALPILESISELGVEYVEDPLPTHASIEDYAELCNRSPVAIALDAPVESLEMVDRIIEARAADILVLKPQRLGGLDVVMLAAQRGKEAGIRVTLTGSLESSVGTCANFQLAAALPEPRFACGLGTSMFFKEDFAPMPPARAGVYRLSDLPTRFLGA
jgi:O-succinylbenzoate synthase